MRSQKNDEQDGMFFAATVQHFAYADGKTMSETLIYKVDFVLDRNKYDTEKKRKDAIIQARHLFFTSGGREQFEGVHVIGWWRNPDRRNEIMARWKNTDEPGQSIEDFYSTLHGSRGALHQLAAIDEREYAAWTRKNKERKKTKAKRTRKTVSRKSRKIRRDSLGRFAKAKKSKARSSRLRKTVRKGKSVTPRRRPAKSAKARKNVSRPSRSRNKK
jgi:hypothetical protein